MAQTLLDPRMLNTAQALLAMSGANLTGISVGDTWTYQSSQALSSGSDHTFTGFAAGTKHIWITCRALDVTGDANLEVLLGDAGGIETSGYVSISGGNDGSKQTATSHFNTTGTSGNFDANQLMTGVIQLVRSEGSSTHQWSITGSIGLQHTSSSHVTCTFAGTKTLSAELTQVKIELSGNAFHNSGTIIAHSE